jgi:hypothetical protein
MWPTRQRVLAGDAPFRARPCAEEQDARDPNGQRNRLGNFRLEVPAREHGSVLDGSDAIEHRPDRSYLANGGWNIPQEREPSSDTRYSLFLRWMWIPVNSLRALRNRTRNSHLRDSQRTRREGRKTPPFFLLESTSIRTGAIAVNLWGSA